MVKQFGQSESICGVMANRDVYSTGAKKFFSIAESKNGVLTVGGLN
ncbi:unnamed protein product [Strongylus vulgaris]|uniref:Uncharacterized protein n=1 Tax=Strongylus vulgaris TaxID=40348 RepID=A0A3P7IYM4_STRVU|nr:unnamed protein product [Strongylus vulgaris]